MSVERGGESKSEKKGEKVEFVKPKQREIDQPLFFPNLSRFTMRASCGFLPERTTLSTRGRCRSQLRPAVDTAASALRVVKFVTTSDRRRQRRDQQLLVVAGASTSTSTSSASLFPRGSPTRLAPSATGGGEASSSNNSIDAESSPPSSPSLPSLVLYSKKDCPLCQGLEEKVRAALARGAFLPGSKLKGMSLEVRDIETDEAWRAAFAMEVPVLFWRKEAAGGGGDKETPVPRSPPRTTVEKLSTTLEAAMPLD